MTQDELAKGICSASLLSKIETGSRTPSKELFIALMDAMGVNGYSFFTMYASDSALVVLKRRIREAADHGDADLILECLHLFKNEMDNTSLEDVIYFNYTIQLYYRMCGHKGKGFGKTSLRYLEALHPGLLDNMDLFTCGLTRQERTLINGVGLGFLDLREYDMAISFFRFLYSNTKESADEVFEVNRTRAVALNNMALAMVGKREYMPAEEMCFTAFKKSYVCNDVLKAGILLTYIKVLEGMQQFEKARRISEYIRFQNSINECMQSKLSDKGPYSRNDGMILI